MNEAHLIVARHALEQSAADDELFPPMFLAEYANDHMDIVVLPTSGHPYDVLRSVARSIIRGKLQAATLITDAYMLTNHVVDGDMDAAREQARQWSGNLQAMFEAGDPSVTEALTIVYAERTGGGIYDVRSEGTNMPYVRISDGSIHWTEIENQDDGEHEGRMVDLIESIVMASTILPDEPMTMQEAAGSE